jgi:hypothetical protein
MLTPPMATHAATGPPSIFTVRSGVRDRIVLRFRTGQRDLGGVSPAPPRVTIPRQSCRLPARFPLPPFPRHLCLVIRWLPFHRMPSSASRAHTLPRIRGTRPSVPATHPGAGSSPSVAKTESPPESPVANPSPNPRSQALRPLRSARRAPSHRRAPREGSLFRSKSRSREGPTDVAA